MQITYKKPVLMLLVLMATQPLFAEELIREFRGSRPMLTAEFEVDAPWILDWRVSGDYSREMAVDVSLIEALTNIHQGNVLKTKIAGNGVRLSTKAVGSTSGWIRPLRNGLFVSKS